MTTTTALQSKTLSIVQALAATGEVSEYAARTAGARVDALGALVRKGLLTVRYGDFVMPAGPLAGETLTSQSFYSIP